MQEIIREWETSMSMKEKLSFNKMGNYYEVEMETIKRKYDVDIQKLMECLNQHRTIKLSEIAERLNRPKTMVEHWFRKDKCFAIPDADIWMELKALLGIETTEFDESIMTFVTDGSKYDMSGRIYTGDTSPTITTDCANNLYMLKPNKFIDEKTIPMVYPLVMERDDLLQKLLIAKHFQGHWWSYLLQEMPSDSFEYCVSKYMIPITIDQRYGKKELDFIKEIIVQ